MTVIEQTSTRRHSVPCDAGSRVTRSLLGYGVIAGPLYVGVALSLALTQPGFDLTRHAWSLLSNGDLGWIQIANFVVTGLMTVAGAVGLHRAGTGTWLPRLVAAYGVSLLGAGAFRADPAMGFPAGTPADAATVTWHGMTHMLAGGIGFGCMIAACVVAGRAFTRRGRRGWAAYSWVSGVALFAGFAGVASGSHGALTTLPFAAAIVLVWSWLTALSARTYRDVH